MFPSHRGQAQIHIYTKSDKNFVFPFTIYVPFKNYFIFTEFIASSLFVCDFNRAVRTAFNEHEMLLLYVLFSSSRAYGGICSMWNPSCFFCPFNSIKIGVDGECPNRHLHLRSFN